MAEALQETLVEVQELKLLFKTFWSRVFVKDIGLGACFLTSRVENVSAKSVKISS